MINYNKKKYNLGNLPNWLTNLRDELNLSAVGTSFVRLPKDKGYTYIHKHEYQEEVYIVLSGKGIIYLDESLIQLSKGDIIRVNPEVYRALKADKECELVCLVFGALPPKGYPKNTSYGALIDDGLPNWEKLPPWYEGNKKVIALNKKLRNERVKSINKYKFDRKVGK